MAHDHAARIRSLREVLVDRGLPAILISDNLNRAYLSGFEGSSGYLVVTEARAKLLTDFRYTQQAAAEAPCYDVVRHASDFGETVGEILQELEVKQLGFEAAALTYQQYTKLRDLLGEVELVPTERVVEELRAVKDEHELDLLREAVRIADEAFRTIIKRGTIRPGVTELQVARELEEAMKDLGAEGPAFPFIVASGTRSALPHGRATNRRIEPGDLVTIDFGARYQGYNSDCTRTLVVGSASSKQREVYETVLRAQRNAARHLAPGMTGAEADSLARDIIAEAGYGEEFGHSLGHGIGRAVHEAPSVSQRNDSGTLVPGNVISNEPGIYLPGWGGVRIEDLVAITDDGNETLTRLEYRELTELPVD